LTEAARLTGHVESVQDRMVVSLRLGLANWKSGDRTSAKINFDEALKLVESFPAQHSTDFYRQSIAEARMEVGDVEGADRTLGQIKNDSQRSEAFRTVGLVQAGRGDFKGAILKAPAIQNAENRDKFLQSISEMQLEASNGHKSQEVDEWLYADPCPDIAAADGVESPDERAGCLTYWGGQLATEGQIGAALEILRRAHEESHLIMDLNFRAYTLEEVARGQAQAGSMNEATRSLAEAKPIALAAYRKIKLEHGWTRIVQDLVELEVEWGDFDGAGSSLAQVEDGEKMNVRQSVARAVVENGHKKEALAWATSQIFPRDRALALIGIADALLSPTQSKDGHLTSGPD
jgi:hypothetical protein